MVAPDVLLDRVYGLNWASVTGRESGLTELEHLVDPGFESKLSEETGGRTVSGIRGLRAFGNALETDFEQLTYEAESIETAPDGRLVVVGRIFGRGRNSGLPLAGVFGHVWTIEDGTVRRMDAYLDPDEARRAAGLESAG